MRKRLVSIILLFLILMSMSLDVYAVEDLKVNAKSAILLDASTGAIIYSLNENDRLAPASITKIMTLLLGMEAVEKGRISLEDEVMVSEHASSIKGSTVYLEAGEIQIAEELFKAIAINAILISTPKGKKFLVDGGADASDKEVASTGRERDRKSVV